MNRESGFTMVELMIVIAIASIMASVAVPSIIDLIPTYRLKGAADDIFSNMQLAKMGAIKENHKWAIIFDTSVSPGKYYVCSDDGANNTWDGPGGDDTIQRTIDLSDYRSSVDYGHGIAPNPIEGSFEADDITYSSNTLIFNARGTCTQGYVYLKNSRQHSYAVGTRSSGIIRMKRSTGSGWN
jgi:prepilin-type N-terminal cleavage/methylation domain-containing protein